jgi:hypothetical protein
MIDFADHFDYIHLNRSIWDHLLIRLRGLLDSTLGSTRFSQPIPQVTVSPPIPNVSVPPPIQNITSHPSIPNLTFLPPIQNITSPPSIPPPQPHFPSPSRKPLFHLDSVIISQTPDIFAPIEGSKAILIYRGSRDGFGATDFHEKCDGHSNTLVIVETRNGFIFGGFSPCEWDSSFTYKQDDSMRSFLFTLKNPHGMEPTTFPLKEDRKQCAIYCFPSRGPIFGGGCDLFVSDLCNVNDKSYTRAFGDTYRNTTLTDGRVLFTGEKNFIVKEIEIFEIVE